MFPRFCKPLLSNSFFLLGARGTGKSCLVRRLLAEKEPLTIDLLIPELERRLRRRPSLLSSMIEERNNVEWVFIDEIQKVPELLDLVHRHIELDKIKFALTGSSARKLKRGAANLLAGRAYAYQLFPLTFAELGQHFEINTALTWGTLPRVVGIGSPEERRIFLETYTHTYLREDILAEQIIRKVAPFERFLEVAAQMNGEVLNFAKIGREIGSDSKMVSSYFTILCDTMMGFFLQGYSPSARKRATLAPKFYFFDIGVKRALDFTLEDSIGSGTYGYGKLFETLVIQQIYRLNSYFRRNYELSFIRTQNDVEIDLVLRRGRNKLILIEIKSTDEVRSDHLRSLKTLGKDLKPSARYCLSNDPVARVEDGIRVIPWQAGVVEIMECDTLGQKV